MRFMDRLALMCFLGGRWFRHVGQWTPQDRDRGYAVPSLYCQIFDGKNVKYLMENMFWKH